MNQQLLKSITKFLDQLPQETNIKIYDGQSGQTIHFVYVDEYKTDDKKDLMRWESEGGR